MKLKKKDENPSNKKYNFYLLVIHSGNELFLATNQVKGNQRYTRYKYMSILWEDIDIRTRATLVDEIIQKQYNSNIGHEYYEANAHLYDISYAGK